MGVKGNSLSGVGAIQAPCPPGTQAPLLFGEALLEKVALSVPKASASSAGHLVGRPKDRHMWKSKLAILQEVRREPELRLGSQAFFLLHLLVEVNALSSEYSAVGGRWGLETGIETREGPKGRNLVKPKTCPGVKENP